MQIDAHANEWYLIGEWALEMDKSRAGLSIFSGQDQGDRTRKFVEYVCELTVALEKTVGITTMSKRAMDFNHVRGMLLFLV